MVKQQKKREIAAKKLFFSRLPCHRHHDSIIVIIIFCGVACLLFESQKGRDRVKVGTRLTTITTVYYVHIMRACIPQKMYKIYLYYFIYNNDKSYDENRWVWWRNTRDFFFKTNNNKNKKRRKKKDMIV